jgi:predicted acetyltransferase
MKITTLPESEIYPDLDAAIRKSLCIVFPDDISTYSQTRAWHGSVSSRTHFIEDKGNIIAHLGVVDRHIVVGDMPLRIAGIQGVMVLPEYRRRGLSDRLLIAAMEDALHRGFHLGLLFCLPVLEKVYTRCGWNFLPKRNVIRVDENGDEKQLSKKNIDMVYPQHKSSFPDGKIHLHGHDW